MKLLLLAVLWILYLAMHSFLASLTVKRWVAVRWPSSIPRYRLTFNAIALILIVPLLWSTMHSAEPPLWRWTGVWAWIANGLTLLAVAGFIFSLRYYDMAEFLGLRQWRRQERSVLDQEHLQISPLHRFVRHPWYFMLLVVIWTRDMDAARLVAVGLVTLYLILGSALEDRKLALYHGDAYRLYRARVPSLVPLPWRRLTQAEAEALVTSVQLARVDTS